MVLLKERLANRKIYTLWIGGHNDIKEILCGIYVGHHVGQFIRGCTAIRPRQ